VVQIGRERERLDDDAAEKESRSIRFLFGTRECLGLAVRDAGESRPPRACRRPGA
jgi:hypothetical protein